MASKKDAKQRNNKGKRQMSPNSLANLKPFDKGDPLINRKGRPTTLRELRELVQEIGNEPTESNPNWTRLYLMLRRMYTSRAASDVKEILDRGWGKVPQPISGDPENPLTVKFEDVRAKLIRKSSEEPAQAATGGAPR